jgi:hypothetical protein
MQKKLDPLGQKLCFHPVSTDFTAVPGMNAVEYLLEHMPELTLCLDLYHLMFGPGGNRQLGAS